MSPELLSSDPLARSLVLNLRLPRLITAFLLGMSLAAAGAVMQMLFRNPLVEPGFLGVTQGAAFGAGLSILLMGGSSFATQTSAIIFGFAGLALSYLLARRIRFGGWVLRLVLAGIAVSALFSSGVGVLKVPGGPNQPAARTGLLDAGWIVCCDLVRPALDPALRSDRPDPHLPDALAVERPVPLG